MLSDEIWHSSVPDTLYLRSNVNQQEVNSLRHSYQT